MSQIDVNSSIIQIDADSEIQHIEVLSSIQVINVNPITAEVSIVLAGPPGIQGIQGIPGPSGEIALDDHINDPEPHPAYDDMPSLVLIFENHLL